MTNVIPFRRDGGSDPELAQAPAPRIDAAKLRRHGMSFARGAGGVMFRIMRLALFLPMLWLRWPIRILLGVAIVGLFLAMPFIWFGMADADPKRMTLFLTAAGSWFGMLVFLWCYDSLLLRLSPAPIFLR